MGNNPNLLAKAWPLEELKGLIGKKLTVPAGKTGIAVFKDGKSELFTSGENRVISSFDRLAGKGAGFWAGYIPEEHFSVIVSITNLLSGDDKLLDLNLLCDVSVNDPKNFFLNVVVPPRELKNQSVAIDIPELFSGFATIIRNYTAEDLIKGELDAEISKKAKSLLGLMLPEKGIKFEALTMVSFWRQEDRLAIEEQLFLLDQKMKDIEFDKKLAEVESKEEFDQLLNSNGIEMPKQASIFSFFKPTKKNDLNQLVQEIKNEDQPGHNFRMKSLLIKKEIDKASPKKNPILQNWWVPRVIWMVFVLLIALGATFYLTKGAEKFEWMGNQAFYIAIWTFAIGAIIESVTKLFKQWEAFFADSPYQSNVLGMDNIKFKDRQEIDELVREQLGMELGMQRDIFNELRSRVYKMGEEDLALELRRVERKIDEGRQKVKDLKIGKPAYLREDMKLTKTAWNYLMDEEEIILVKAALLSEEAQTIQLEAGNPQKIASKLSDYETKLDSFINAFIARERVLHTESLN